MRDADSCGLVQLGAEWGPKGLDWSNRAEVLDLYSTHVREVQDPAKSQELRKILDISDDEAANLESLSQKELATAGSHSDSFF